MSADHSSDSDSESEEAERSDVSEVAAKKRKQSKTKKSKRGREDVKALRKLSTGANDTLTAVNKRKAVPDDSGPDT